MRRQSACHAIARDGLIIAELDGEAMVYDTVAHHAHCVSPDAYRVFQRCDGRSSPASIAERLALSPALVAQALVELERAGLVSRAARVDLSRRRLMKKMALTTGLAIAAPMVWSIVAPSVAQAASVVCLTGGGLAAGCTNATAGACCNPAFIGGNAAGTCINTAFGPFCNAGGACGGNTCH